VAAAVALLLLVISIKWPLRWPKRWPMRWKGTWYRLTGRRPDPDVDPLTLADRIRSTLGPVEKRLDLPHIHVMVEDHVALLHGDVGWPRDAAVIEETVRHVSGVRGVESYLHVGLLPSDVRPSDGRIAKHPPSDAMRRLLAAARAAGADESQARGMVRATLSVLAERIPWGERQQFIHHLPRDVRALSAPPRRTGTAAAGVRTAADLVGLIVSEQADSPDPEAAPAIVGAVLAETRRLVPEEADDIAAVLPSELRELWQAGAPA
jgi:uncharacterized protein (DUF2267 family)